MPAVQSGFAMTNNSHQAAVLHQQQVLCLRLEVGERIWHARTQTRQNSIAL